MIRGITSVLVLGATAHAGIVNVSTSPELIAAIDAAAPGDEIVLATGTYSLAGASCDVAGTATQPIIVRSAEPLGAVLDLTGVEGFKVSAAHWQFEDLDIRGACASAPTCEHAFHVYGAAHDFVLRGSRVRDFNAQLKVNAGDVNGVMVAPDRGLIEYNEIGDTAGRATSNPVTKLNIDTGDDWIVRGNYLHDANKLQGDTVSYVAFMKSGGKRGLMERNLVICAKDIPTGGTRIGLSFGGGGTGNAFCAPAFDPAVPCSVEHDGGTMRNNIIVNCSDVGIYLNEARDSHILYNTLIKTTGVDFRFATTSGEAIGNVLTGVVRTRDSATMSSASNRENVSEAMFASMYRAPLVGDLVVTGDVASLIGAGPVRADVLDDYCGAIRPTGMFTLGAIEHSLGGCETTRPPVTEPVEPGGDGDPPHGDGVPINPTAGDAGCCDTSGRGGPGAFLLGLAVLLRLRRRRSKVYVLDLRRA